MFRTEVKDFLEGEEPGIPPISLVAMGVRVQVSVVQ